MPSLVQHADNNSASGTSVTMTLGSSVTAGNGIAVAVSLSTGTPSVSGGSDTFTKAVNDGNDLTYIFYILASAGGYSSVTVSAATSGLGLSAWVYEIPPLLAVDNTHSGTSALSSTWSSGAAAGTTTSEFVVGAGQGSWNTSASTITGPSSPWTNEPSHIITANEVIGVSGFQIATATGSYTYSGTSTGTGTQANSGACVAVFKFSPPTLRVAPVNLRQAVKRSAYY